MATSQQQLHVIGLISGGKDSFFSILHCLANNHRLLALANLHPPALSHSDKADDLNSYMYQTAGHNLIPWYTEALGLPLYRQEIRGGAANPSKYYKLGAQPDAEDEIDSLMSLLQKVILQHPRANAVCSGAILSTYQRTRIESVARHLDLIPLSYLWQYPSLPPASSQGLLDDMTAVGFDARIVKVASGGLDEDLLWCNLLDPAVRRKVQRATNKFGGSVLGEGGEFETIVVDGPGEFWKGKIEVPEHERLVRKGVGGEAWLKFSEGCGRNVAKGKENSGEYQNHLGRLRQIGIWDEEFSVLINTLTGHVLRQNSKTDVPNHTDKQRNWTATLRIIKNGSTLNISNVIALEHGPSASEQMSGIILKLSEILSATNSKCDASDIVFTAIYLHSMTDFAPVNAVYGKLFTKPNPPARVTVACGNSLPNNALVMVSFIIDLSRAGREGLHVQSRSYWAPANIGPYSQAISVPLSRSSASLVYVAGQIPLIPASMDILSTDYGEKINVLEFQSTSLALFRMQVCLALQHLWRIGRAMGVSWWAGGIAFLSAGVDTDLKALVAWKSWNEIHSRELWVKEEGKEDDDDEGLDVWDRKYGGRGSFPNISKESHSLPDFERMPSSILSTVPGFFAVEVDELPRKCEIEWQGLGVSHSGSSMSSTEHVDSYIEVRSVQELYGQLKELPGTEVDQARNVHVYTPFPALVDRFAIQITPCRTIWGREGTELVAGIVIQGKHVD